MKILGEYFPGRKKTTPKTKQTKRNLTHQGRNLLGMIFGTTKSKMRENMNENEGMRLEIGYKYKWFRSHTSWKTIHMEFGL